MCPSHTILVKSKQDVPDKQDVSDRKNGKAKKSFVPPPSKGMEAMNESMPGHRTQRNYAKFIKRHNSAMLKELNNRPVPMVLFLTSTALRQLEEARWNALPQSEKDKWKAKKKRVPIEKMDFSDSVTEWDLPIFGGHYYSTPAALIAQVGYYTSAYLGLPLYNLERRLRFLSLIRDGAKRNPAAEQMKKEAGDGSAQAQEREDSNRPA